MDPCIHLSGYVYPLPWPAKLVLTASADNNQAYTSCSTRGSVPIGHRQTHRRITTYSFFSILVITFCVLLLLQDITSWFHYCFLFHFNLVVIQYWWICHRLADYIKLWHRTNTLLKVNRFKIPTPVPVVQNIRFIFLVWYNINQYIYTIYASYHLPTVYLSELLLRFYRYIVTHTCLSMAVLWLLLYITSPSDSW